MGTLIGDNFDEKQLLAIDLLAQGYNNTETAEEIKVSVSTISRWKNNSAFLNAIVNKARELLKLELPAIYRSASKNAIKGSAQHTKILLDHLDNLEKQAVDLSGKTITFTWDIKE